MGLVCCQAGDRSEAEESANKKSKNIDSILHKERRATESKVKLLLLGTGDSGKSTFVKQMKHIHKDGFSNAEVMKFAKVLQENCIQSMQKILRSEEVKVTKGRKEAKEAVLRADIDDLFKVSNEIKILWQEKSIKEAFEKRSELRISIPSTSDYYFDNVDRFAHENFQPTPDDMFRAKLKTTGISEVVFEISKIEFTLVDVGGQRSERRKWLYCFDDVTSVIFLAALDEYDMTLEEDPSKNRFEESLELFSEVTDYPFFKPHSWILFLNKSDLLNIKVKNLPLHDYFNDFPEDKNGSNYEDCLNYLQVRYQAKFKGSRLYPHVTCAIDTTNCRKVFTSVRDTVITGALTEAGF
jgi:GTPase SAR1 family protein